MVSVLPYFEMLPMEVSSSQGHDSALIPPRVPSFPTSRSTEPPSEANVSPLVCYPVTASSYSFRGDQANHGFTRIPCKARGVRNGHNASNAYIEIPPNAPHGLILVCSNVDCYNSGRRFRYCAVCQTPVAKRNFHVRHGHGLAIIKGARESAASIHRASHVRQEVRRRSRCVSPESYEMGAMAKQSILELSIEEKEEQREPVEQPPKKQFKSTSHGSKESNKPLSADEMEWLTLLRTKPDFGSQDDIAKWMRAIVECSMTPQGAPVEDRDDEAEAFRMFFSEDDDIDQILSDSCHDEQAVDNQVENFDFDFDME